MCDMCLGLNPGARSHFGPTLRQELQRHFKLRKLRRSEATFNRGQYQIVCVDWGLATEAQEQTNLKRIQSQRIC